MNKLIKGEASRVIAVLDDSLVSLDIVLELPPSGVAGNKLADAERHWDKARANLERNEYYEALAHLEALQTAESRYLKAKRANAREQADLAVEALHEATRQVCRSVRRNPGVLKSLERAGLVDNVDDDDEEDREGLEHKESESKRHESHESFDHFPQNNSDSFDGSDTSSRRKSFGSFRSSTDERNNEAKYSEEKQPYNFERAPSRGGNVGAIRKEYSLTLLRRTLRAFRENMLDQLSTTVEQKQARADFFQELNVRIREMEEDLVMIKTDLEAEAVREKELISKKQAETKLWHAIQEVRSSYDREMGEIGTFQTEEKQSIQENFLQRNKIALESFDKASDAFLQECNGHTDLEDNLRKKLIRATTEVNTLIDSFDIAMLEKRAQYDLMKERYVDEAARLAILEEHFRKVDRDLANEAEEDRIIAEELAAIEALKKRDHDAAARIQALFRGNQCRKKLKKKKKGKGKGKGKGKAGAKKKKK